MKWEDNIRKVIPYVPGEQPNIEGMIKINTNENPYPPSPKVREVLDSIDCTKNRLYPDPTIKILVDALAKTYNVPSERVFVGIGSDDVLAMSFMTFFNSDKPILFADITYSFYDVWAEEFRIPYKTVPLNDDFTMNFDGFCVENGGVVIANPNAPTGLYEGLDEIERVIKANPDVVVIVDEAYIDFGGKSALSLIDKYENLLVVQTFSKSRSMAGARIGFAIGQEKLIKYLQDVKYSYNSYTMDMTTQQVGAAVLSDPQYFADTCKKIIATRERTKTRLTELGFTYPDSMSNFIFATHESVPAVKIFEALRERKIFVRYFSSPRISNYLRITIGTDEEMDKVIAALGEIIAEYSR